MRRPILAVDADETLFIKSWPDIGDPMPGSVEALKELAKDFELIIWTCRDDFNEPYGPNRIEEACVYHGIPISGVNKSSVQLNFDSRKIFADIYIDDRSIGGIPPWTEIKMKLIKDLPRIRSKISADTALYEKNHENS